MVVLICDGSIEVDDDVADYIIRLPQTDEQLMPMAAAAPLQLIAYYTSVLKGNDVDKPRNLDKIRNSGIKKKGGKFHERTDYNFCTL